MKTEHDKKPAAFYLLKDIPTRIYTRFKAVAKNNNTTVRAMLIDYMAETTNQPRYVNKKAEVLCGDKKSD